MQPQQQRVRTGEAHSFRVRDEDFRVVGKSSGYGMAWPHPVSKIEQHCCYNVFDDHDRTIIHGRGYFMTRRLWVQALSKLTAPVRPPVEQLDGDLAHFCTRKPVSTYADRSGCYSMVCSAAETCEF